MGVVHGGDSVFTGPDSDLDFALGVLKRTYESKNRKRLGLGAGDVKRIEMLGRWIELTEEGMTWEADPRHNDISTWGSRPTS